MSTGVRNPSSTVALAATCVALAGMVGILPGKSVVAQKKGPNSADLYDRRMKVVLQTANSNVAARRLAMERLQFLRRLNRKYSVELHEYGGHESLLLFPILRSDRVYAVVWAGMWPETEGGADVNCIVCFQRKNGNSDKFIYRVDFVGKSDSSRDDDQPKAPSKPVAIRSLLDYIQSGEYDVRGPISRYAKEDLTAQREYVGYTDEYINVSLKVFQLSTGEYPHNYFSIEHYPLYQGPVPGAKSTASEFYNKYGLPVSLSELKMLQPQLPAELLVPMPDPFPGGCSTD